MAVTDLDQGSPPVSLPATVPANIPSRRGVASIASRAIWLAVAYVVVTGGLLVALLMQLRSETIVASKRELSAFAQLTAGHTFEVAAGLEEALKFTEVTLSVSADSSAADADSIGTMLRDVASNARGLKDILVLDAQGKVVYQATGRAEIGRDWSDRPYFTRFRQTPALKFGLGAPFRRSAQSAAGEWFIPVAHSWRRSNGDFAGVIVGLMDRQVFDRAWTFDSEIAGLSIALISADGAPIMRRPFDDQLLGRSPVDRETLAQLSGRDAATLETRSPFDNETQLVAYRRVAGYPDLLTLIAQPMEVVLAGWWRVVWIAGSSWLVASLVLGALGAWLAREMKARSAVESRYHVLFNSIPYPVVVSDDESRRIVAFNDATTRQYGWELGPKATLPEDFSVLAARRGEFSPDVATVISGQRHRNRDGATIDVELAVRRIDYNGRPALLTVAVDVSDRLRAEKARRAAEEQLRHSQKLDVLGQLTGGIAHDFNNILMVIMANAEVLAEKDDLDAETRKGLDRIADSAQRAEDLTRQMLAFSRKQPLRARPTNVNDLVADTGKLLRRTLGGQIEIESILADDVWPVDIDRAQLETSLVNLCLNARDAMPTGGRVLIETQNVSLDAAQAAALPAGSFVQITVSDTGRGIPASDLDRIFEPFFTTKAIGKGSGLGLSMVYGFIKQSNGHISVTSEVDHGTVFRLWLPRFAGPLPEAAARSSASAVGGAERILVVEDNPQVRASVVRQARSLGYAVTEADDGAAGLAACEAAPRPYDLMLTDVVMPGMNGKALADAVAARWPTTKIVFMSGYTDNVLGNRGEIDGDVRLLSKPFRKSDLAQVIRQALDEG
jgi:PAS domain S-box-containing protein